jgi:hypothetical protein
MADHFDQQHLVAGVGPLVDRSYFLRVSHLVSLRVGRFAIPTPIIVMQNAVRVPISSENR